jgi:uncharacterized phage infection (PIP) family protein YhgE
MADPKVFQNALDALRAGKSLKPDEGVMQRYHDDVLERIQSRERMQHAAHVAEFEKQSPQIKAEIERIEQAGKHLTELAATRQRELAEAQAFIANVTPETDIQELAQAILAKSALEKVVEVINAQLRALDDQLAKLRSKLTQLSKLAQQV